MTAQTSWSVPGILLSSPSTTTAEGLVLEDKVALPAKTKQHVAQVEAEAALLAQT